MPYRALRLIFSDWSVGKLVVIPTMIGAAVYFLTFYTIYHQIPSLLEQVLPNQEGVWGQMLYYLTFSLLVLFLIVVAGFIYGTFGRLVIAPFSEIICVRTEKILGCKKVKELTFQQSLKDLPRLLRVECLKLAFSTLFIASIFVLTVLVPPLGFISTLFGFWVIAFEFVDYPMEIRHYSFRDRVKWATRAFLPLTAFGVLLMVLISIPLIGILGLPVGVVGGTMVFHYVENGLKV